MHVNLLSFLARFRRSFALLAVLLTLNMVASAAANDYITFSVKCNGVLGDVIAKGYSPLVIGYAVDKNGDELAPGDFEKYRGTTLRVPKSALKGKKAANVAEAKQKFAAIAAAHTARVKKIGQRKYELALNKCVLPPPPVAFQRFDVKPVKLTMTVGETAKFDAVAMKTDGLGYTLYPEVNTKQLVVTRSQEDGRTFTIKALLPGDHKVTLAFEGHTMSIPIHVEDLSTWAKYWSNFGDGFLGQALGWMTLLALLLLLFVFVRALLRRFHGPSSEAVVQDHVIPEETGHMGHTRTIFRDPPEPTVE